MRKLLENILERLGLVTYKRLKASEDFADSIIDRIELGKTFIVLSNDDVLKDNVLNNKDIIVRGGRVIIESNTLIGSQIFATGRCEKLMIIGNSLN